MAPIVLRGLALGAALCACGDNLVGDAPPRLAPPLPSAPTASLPCTFQYGSHGVVDRGIAYTYDDLGFPTAFTTTSGDAASYSYDDNHFVLHFTYYVPTEPVLDYEETYTRDADGRVLTYVERTNGISESFKYEYDALGRVAGIGLDRGIMFYTYAGDDLNPTKGQLEVDARQVDTFVFTASPDGRVLHAEIDHGHDGVTDGSVDMIFDDARRVTDMLAVSYPTSKVTLRNHTGYAADGAVILDNFATADGADDVSYAIELDRNGVWTATSVTSPSLAAADSAYLETPATYCWIKPVRPAWPLRLLPPRGAGRALPRLPGSGTECRHSVSVGC